VKGILRAEMARRGITYDQLAVKLAEFGVNDTAANIRNKVARGEFSAVFFARCLKAVGCSQMELKSMSKMLSIYYRYAFEPVILGVVMPHRLALKRVYVAASPDDGHRVLVERLWPRELRKAEAVDLWLKEVVPPEYLQSD
jgi:hypothetical protein